MKPFDLDAAKRGEPIVTRNGTPVKFIAHVPEAMEDERVIILNNELILLLYENGKYYRHDSSLFDLFMAEPEAKPEAKPKPVIRYLWAIKSEGGWSQSSYFFTESEAKERYSFPVTKIDRSATEFEE